MARQTGVKFSRPGVSVDRVVDYDSYFYTGWPWLKIIKEGKVFVGSKTTVPNPVGYPCFYMVFGKTTGLREFGISVNSNSLIIDTGGFYPSEDCYYYLFALSLKKPYASDKVNLLGGMAGSRSPYGIKYNPGGVNEGADKLFMINSDFRAPLVHAVVASPNYPLTSWTGSGVEYFFDLPYAPLVFGFSSTDNENFTMATTTAQTPPKTIFPGVGPWGGGSFKAGSVIVSGQASWFGAIVILKNPSDQGAVINVDL